MTSDHDYPPVPPPPPPKASPPPGVRLRLENGDPQGVGKMIWPDGRRETIATGCLEKLPAGIKVPIATMDS